MLDHGGRPAEVDLLGCEQADAAVPVLGVVPREEVAAESFASSMPPNPRSEWRVSTRGWTPWPERETAGLAGHLTPTCPAKPSAALKSSSRHRGERLTREAREENEMITLRSLVEDRAPVTGVPHPVFCTGAGLNIRL